MTFQRVHPRLLPGSAFGGAVIKTSKPPVPRHVDRAVVALEVAMMQLVKEITGPHPLLISDHQLLIALSGKRAG